MMTTLRVLAGCILFLTLLAGCATEMKPNDNAPDVTVHIAWNGYFKSPGWTEAKVTLSSNSLPWTGQVRITDRTQSISYSNDIALGINGRTTVHIPFQLNGPVKPVLELVQNGKVVENYGILEFSPTPQNSGVCLVIGVKPVNAVTQSAHCQVIAYYDSWENVPTNPLVWESLARIYITSALQAAKAPTPEQLNTLETWVSQGGQLFIFGETTLSQIVASQSWISISVSQGTSVHNTISTQGKIVVFPPEFLSATLKTSDDRLVIPTVVSEAGVLAVRQQYGWGSIDAAGWSITATPEDWFAELDLVPLNEAPIPAGIVDGGELRGYHIEDIFRVNTAANTSPWLFVILMLVYVGVIGPGILFITKKRNQPLLTWILVPAWIAIGILGVSLVLQGTLSQVYPITGEMAILEYPLHARNARATQFIAIFAPNSKNITWKTSAYGQPLFGRYQNDYWYETGEAFPLDITYHDAGDDLAIITASDPLGVMTWSAVNYIPMPNLGIRSIKAEQITPRGQVSPDTIHIIADIQSELTLEDIHLVYPDSTYLVYVTEEIKAGEATNLDVLRPIRSNINFNGYFDYCSINSLSMSYLYSSMYPPMSGPGAISERFPEAHPVKSYKIPDDGVCYLVATTNQLPLDAHDISKAEGSTCLLVAIPCADLKP